MGPRLASLLIQPENLDSSSSINETIETDMSDIFKSYTCLQELWHILNLDSNTTLLLCSNGLHLKTEFHSIPSNVILVEYGFQVNMLFCKGVRIWNLNSFIALGRLRVFRMDGSI